MFTIGCDLASYKAGIAVADLETARIIHFAKIETNPALSDEDRAEEVADRVLALIKQYEPLSAGLENNKISYGGKNTGLQEYCGHGNLRVIRRYCVKKGIAVRWRTRGQMYQAVLGKGKGGAPKAELITFFQGQGLHIENDDQSDGCGHAWAEMRMHGVI
jgi:Holliday junction resolvasome RuvABC endonuclease subunit